VSMSTRVLAVRSQRKVVVAFTVKGAAMPKIVGVRSDEPVMPAHSRSVSIPTTR
jgi:hypothetical protein